MRRASTPSTVPGAAPVEGSAARAAPGTASNLSRLRRQTRWTSVGLVYGLGLFAVAAVLFTQPGAPIAAVAVLAAASGAVASARLLGHQLDRVATGTPGADQRVPGRPAAVAVAGAVVFVVATQLADAGLPDDRPISWFPVAGVVIGAVAVFQRRRVFVVFCGALAAMALAAATRLAVTGGVESTWVLFEGAVAAAIGVGAISEVHYWDLAVRLDRARLLESELAVAGERLRFAADLHDVQGHHLQVIALKSELATRLVETDPSTAATHMAEVQEHARTALADTRQVVQGYRQASLGEELANAARVLDAAGIDGRVEHNGVAAAERVGELGRQLLGSVVREATTNILRHSRARQARLTLGLDGPHARLAIRNDGATASAGPPGTGLQALAQRLEAAGGTLDWHREDGWFIVTARVPATAEQPA